jgi:HD-GYP domain-containing protein (c-di-GMP phosphodiesterase class II)
VSTAEPHSLIAADAHMGVAASARQPKIGTFTYSLLAAASLTLVAVLGFREDWQLDIFAGLVVLAAAMAPMAIEREEWSTNGSLVAVIIAACVLGPAQAACVGLVGVLADHTWYWRTTGNKLRVRPTLSNVCAYSVFPIAASLVGRHADLDHGVGQFIAIVTLAYCVGFGANVLIIAICHWSEDGIPLSSNLSIDSTLWAELLAAEVSAVGVYAVLEFGFVGLLIAAANLVVFMGLAGRFLKSIDDEREAKAKSIEADEQRQIADDLRRLAEHRLALVAYEQRVTIVKVMEALQAKDMSTGRHSAAVSAYLREFAEFRGMSEAEVKFATVLGLVHDIGKLSVPERTLTKPGRLTRWEMELVRGHSEAGADFVRDLEGFGDMAQVIVSHHERWDGGDPGQFWKMGYPHGLKGDEIPELSCMISVVDTYDAITCRNFTGSFRTHEEALEVLIAEKGRQFRSDLVDQFIDLLQRRPDLRFNPDQGQTFKRELERFLGDPPTHGQI